MTVKKIKRSKVLTLTAILVFATLSIGGIAQVNAETESTNHSEFNRCGVAPFQVVMYLEENGYNDISLSTYGCGCDIIADTQNNYPTLVICGSENIITHEDLN